MFLTRFARRLTADVPVLTTTRGRSRAWWRRETGGDQNRDKKNSQERQESNAGYSKQEKQIALPTRLFVSQLLRTTRRLRFPLRGGVELFSKYPSRVVYNRRSRELLDDFPCRL